LSRWISGLSEAVVAACGTDEYERQDAATNDKRYGQSLNGWATRGII
jgi:hypothetical protein